MKLRGDWIEERTLRTPRVVWIELTSRCPFDCIFCSRRSLRGAGEHMDFTRFRDLIAELGQPEVIRLNYSGESGVYPRLIEAVGLAAATGAQIELVTALAGLNGKRLEGLFEAGLSRMTVSLHTLNPRRFDEIYRFGTLAQVKGTLERAASWRRRWGRGLVLDLAFVAMERNVDELPALAVYARSLGIPVLAVHPVIERDPLPLGKARERNASGHLEAGFRRRLAAALGQAKAQAPDLDIQLSSHELEPRAALDDIARPWPWPLPEGARIATCDQSPFETTHVLADGRVVACEVTEQSELGDLRSQGLSEIWHGQPYREFRRRHARGQHPACTGCIYKSAFLPGAASTCLSGQAPPAQQLLRGWHPADGSGLRWSGASAAFWLPRGINQGQLRLRGILARQQTTSASALVIRLDGEVVYREPGLEAGPRDLNLPLPQQDVDARVLVEIDCPGAASPAQVGQGPDARVLGFGLIGAELVTLQAPLSVLIPERGTPELLGETLAALQRALEGLGAGVEVLVLVNGAERRRYASLSVRYPWVRWHFNRRALGFHGALQRLLRSARHPWVYLLNSDMRLHQDALRVLLRWRRPDLFAIASQIHLADPTRRREETGFTQSVVDAAGALALHDIPPPDGSVRAHLYAGGGASLFQTEPLRRLIADTAPYAPFYFEDADWGIRAWSLGFDVLFHPGSQAIHVHRATIARDYRASTVERIVSRNLGHFRWRYGDCLGASRGSDEAAARYKHALRGLDPRHCRARAAVTEARLRPAFEHLTWKRFPHAQRFRPGRPRVLLISPFSVIPPAHGGARRVLELSRASAGSIDWVLLHDEAQGAARASPSHDAPFREIHPIGGRPRHGADPMERLRAHAHPGLVREMQRLMARTGAQLVCLEHIESLLLIDAIPRDLPVILTLHDAGRDLPKGLGRALRERLPRVSTLVLTTREDRGVWGHPDELVIENGVAIPPDFRPSPDRMRVLAVAPLRYDRNRLGLQRFLLETWPWLRARLPSVELTILGGERAAEYGDSLSITRGVSIVDGFVEPDGYYDDCAVAINPQPVIEGSALKVAEALAHGRIVVTTMDGARGYEGIDSPALIRVAHCADMVPWLVRLLADVSERHRRERSARVDISPWSWELRSSALTRRIATLVG